MGPGEWKMLKKFFFKVLERQNLQNLNNKLMIINQIILAIVKTFSNLKRSFMKKFTTRRQLSKLVILRFLGKFLKGRKHLINNLTFVREKYI